MSATRVLIVAVRPQQAWLLKSDAVAVRAIVAHARLLGLEYFVCAPRLHIEGLDVDHFWRSLQTIFCGQETAIAKTLTPQKRCDYRLLLVYLLHTSEEA